MVAPDGSIAVTVAMPSLLDQIAGGHVACGSDPDLWFAEAPADVELAKGLCRGCPIRRQCLAGAIARVEPWGVWGGELVEHGRVVPRKRSRGRPRKTG
jgi:WhiB family transcriptional regulator, redox-sensing transcriptional regulator